MDKSGKVYFSGLWTFEELLEEVTDQFQNLFLYKGDRYYMGRCEYTVNGIGTGALGYTVYLTAVPKTPEYTKYFLSNDVPTYRSIEDMFNNHIMFDGVPLLEALKVSELDN